MALHVKALNDDTASLFLTFVPSICAKDQKFPETFPGSFTILINPWSSGTNSVYKPKFSKQSSSGTTNVYKPKLSKQSSAVSTLLSLHDLPEPDVIVVSSASPDCCHEESLCQFNPQSHSLVLAEPKAVRRIKRWGHFYPDEVQMLRRYRSKGETLFRIEIPPPSPSGSSGEVTVALLGAKSGFKGDAQVAVGITYRAPTSVLSLCRGQHRSPSTPRNNGHGQHRSPSNPRNNGHGQHRYPSASRNNSHGSAAAFSQPTGEPTVSLLYAPNGIPLSTLHPWLSHLDTTPSSIPLALIHGLARIEAPWYLGGALSSGFPAGLDLAKLLRPMVWIATADTHPSRAASRVMRTDYEETDCQRRAWKLGGDAGRRMEIVRLRGGTAVRIDALSPNQNVQTSTVGEKTGGGTVERAHGANGMRADSLEESVKVSSDAPTVEEKL